MCQASGPGPVLFPLKERSPGSIRRMGRHGLSYCRKALGRTLPEAPSSVGPQRPLRAEEPFLRSTEYRGPAAGIPLPRCRKTNPDTAPPPPPNISEQGQAGFQLEGVGVDKTPWLDPPSKGAQLTGPQNPTKTDPQAPEVTRAQISAKN